MGKFVKNSSGYELSDDVLLAAYLSVANRVGCYREKFVASTENIEAVISTIGAERIQPIEGVPRMLLGDYIRYRIPWRAKNDSRWCGTEGGRKRAEEKPTPDWYLAYLNSEHWQSFKAQVVEEWGHACCLNKRHTKNLEVHHNFYERLWGELFTDVVCLCGACHKKHHKKMQIPEVNPCPR